MVPAEWTQKRHDSPYHRAVIFVEDSNYKNGFVFDIYETETLQRLLEVTAEDGFWFPGAKVDDFASGEVRTVHSIHYYAPK